MPRETRGAPAEAILQRLVDHPTIGRILPSDDPFLAEALPWLDQAEMRFYPDVYAVEGLDTPVPNLMLALTLARSLLARGQGTDRFEDAMADFRRVVRLGRLLRQDDVVVMSDLVGLAVFRIGAEAIYDRARKDGRLDLALAAAVIAGEVPPQRLLSGARMTSIEVAPYVHRGVGGTSITLPDRRFEELRKIALDGPDRRFRLEACGSLSFIATFGSEVQSKQATTSSGGPRRLPGHRGREQRALAPCEPGGPGTSRPALGAGGVAGEFAHKDRRTTEGVPSHQLKEAEVKLQSTAAFHEAGI